MALPVGFGGLGSVGRSVSDPPGRGSRNDSRVTQQHNIGCVCIEPRQPHGWMAPGVGGVVVVYVIVLYDGRLMAWVTLPITYSTTNLLPTLPL